MSIRNILVAFNGGDASVSALRYAASLASRNGGHVTAILAHAARDDYASQSRWISKETVRILASANEEILSAIEAGFHEIKGDLGIGDRVHFRRLNGRVDAVLAKFARNFDLVVVGRYAQKGVDGHVSVHPDRVAMIAGRPVLIVPPGFDAAAAHHHAVIAWDGGRAAARAMSDAMAFLEEDGRVSVITVGDAVEPEAFADLAAHLSRHGIKSTVETLEPSGSIGETIVSYCTAHDAGLLVMGAYEHSKFRSDLLGGVTLQVTSLSPVPILLSH